MFVNDCLNINEKGHLTIGGCDTVELAKEYGTPLYVLDENTIRTTCRSYVESFKKYYNGNGMPLYASKALSCKELCRIADEEHLGLDVVSGGEIYTAQQAGFPMEKTHFHGNNKTAAEIEFALNAGVGTFVVDNLYELELLNDIAGRLNKKAKISFRIKPGVDAHTHNFIRTGQIDSKFGFALETGEAMDGVKAAIAAENIDFKGVHCHIGSQIFDVEPFERAAEVMIGFMADIKAQTGVEVEELDLGGGFGIKYSSDDNPLAYSEYMAKVAGVLKAECVKRGVKQPFIVIEPGRSVAGSAGITLYTVGAVKTIPDIRTYVSIDGGMGDNPRYILYQSTYELICANKADKPKDFKITLAGRCCESGDLIQEDALVQQVEPGDIMAVLSTGAYNYSMSSNYNRIPKPPVVMVSGGESRVVVRRETYEDIIAKDM